MVLKRYPFLLVLPFVGMIVLGMPRFSSADELERGNAAFVQGDYPEAYKIWLVDAENGIANAQVALGSLYAYGRGVPQSDAEAVKWFRRAADQGSPDGLYALAMAVYAGKGVERDLVLSVQLMEKAAQGGNSFAQLMLSAFYEQGVGVEVNAEKAKYWKDHYTAQSASLEGQILDRVQNGN